MAYRFDKFTPPARKAFQYAQEEARRFNHNYIGTEHLLLGVMREVDGVAAKALANLGADLDQLRSSVDSMVGEWGRTTDEDVGLTPRAKRVIECAVDEARSLHHQYIGTEHILLGLLREPDGIAGQVLHSHGVGLDQAREQVVAVLAEGGSASPRPRLGDLPRVVSRALRSSGRAPGRRRSTPDPWRAFGADVNVTQVEALLADLDRLNDEIGYRRVASGPFYECGLVRFAPRQEGESRQITHPDKDVVCYVLRGSGQLSVDSTVRDLGVGDLCRIPAGTPHDFSAVGEPLVLFYTSITIPEAPA